MIKGDNIGLTAVFEEDIIQLMNWRNNENMRKFYREYKELNYQMQLKWFNEKVINDNSTIMFAIRDIKSGQLLGCCGLCYINWVHRNAEISLYIGLDDAYIDKRAYEALRILLRYGYEQIGMEKLWAECYDFDDKRIKMYKDFSFHLDGILRNNYFYENGWHASEIYSLLACEYLDLAKENNI